MTVQIQKRFLVRIPPEARRSLGLQEGDHLETFIENGRLVLVPMRLVPADQAWFWSEKWQEGEKEAERDLQAGRVTKAGTVDDLIKALEK